VVHQGENAADGNQKICCIEKRKFPDQVPHPIFL
jgi:hypothetical protein